MEQLYSIGETARLMGISVQTLRNYSNSGLLKPQFIDEFTGYRYYSFEQFHYIDRIKYLRELGLSLSEIEEILEEGKTDKLVEHLLSQKEKVHEAIQNLQKQEEDIDWYMNYFTYMGRSTTLSEIPYIKEYEKRYILFTEYGENETVEQVETRLAELKNSNSEAEYRRQYGYIADCKSLLEKKFVPLKYFIYLKKIPDNIKKCQIMELKAGEYLCFRGRVRTSEWDPSIIATYFKDKQIPDFVIASEYEDNLVSYHNCPYEVQILINRK